MGRLLLLSTVASVSGLSADALLPSDPAHIGGKKNVLMISADDLRQQFSHQTPAGVSSPTMQTPYINRLASKSLVARSNYAQISISNPSRASVLTGRRPETTRVFDEVSYWRNVAENFTTLPELLKDHGYYTASIGKVFMPGDATGGTGDYVADGLPGGSWSESPWFPEHAYSVRDGKTGETPSWKAVPDTDLIADPLPDTMIADRAAWKLSKFNNMHRNSGEFNFFLAVGFVRPSLPYVVPASKFALYPAGDVPASQTPPSGMPFPAWSGSEELVSFVDQAALRGTKAALMPGEKVAASDAANLRRAYYAAVSHVDDCVGKVLTALDKTGLARRTVVVLWSDHGTHVGENGIWGSRTATELSTAAPFILHVPGMTDGGMNTKIGTYTELTDIYPTVAALAAGIDVPSCPAGEPQAAERLCTMGRNLEPLITSPDDSYILSAYSTAFSQYPRLGDGMHSGHTSNCLLGLQCMMGYSMITYHENVEYRYTEWVAYNSENNLNLTSGLRPNWSMSFANELYAFNLNASQVTIEETNLADNPMYVEIVKLLSNKLHNGPQTGGGWGPWHDEEATRAYTDESLARFTVAKEALARASYKLAKVAPAPANISQSSFWGMWESDIASKLPALPPNRKWREW